MLSESELKSLKGLSDKQVSERIEKHGYNELPSAKKKGIMHIVLEVLHEPMFMLLVACGAIYLMLGDVKEAGLLLGFVFVIMGITIYQEHKTENALEALHDLSSPRALVIRNGEHKRIAGREVVTDDIFIVREGDKIPADGTLLWSMNLASDESLLTGESVPVRKCPAAKPDGAVSRPGGDDLPFVYSGSMVTSGQGVAKVTTTGASTEIGKIGKALQSIEEEDTTLKKETGRLVKKIFIFAISLCLVVVGIYGFARNEWLQGILSGITLAMALLPEEFPVVLTIFLALGAWRMSKKNVLTRRVAAIETLGAATVLCSDKTGTLTQNKMTIKKLFNCTDFYEWSVKTAALPEEFHKLVEYGILASKKDPFDPMEKALAELGYKTLINTEHIHEDWPLVEEYALSKELLALSHVWEIPGTGDYVVSAKGAPEAIFDLCHMKAEEIQKYSEKINVMASEGLRILGVATTNFDGKELPSSQHDFEFKFMGLIGWADPVRETVPAAIAECKSAGIRVAMITGDYPVTAQNIARQIGLENPEEVLTGPELEKLDPGELAERVKRTNIFARVVPEQKLLIVNAMKANGEVVAMTGDGVNDAPALKAAHIGVAMGERGTDVARESSALVLLDDDFTSIVEAVKMGRRIFDNLKKAMAYIISVHVPIAGISLLPILMGWPVVLFPVHVVFLELIIDPACSVIFEAEPPEENIMKRKPRDPDEPLFGKHMFMLSFMQGFFSFLAVAGVFWYSLKTVGSESEARTLAFITLVISNLGIILVNRSWTKNIFASLKVKNTAISWVVGGTIIFLGMVVYVPVLQNIFHFSYMHLNDVVISLSLGIVSVAWFEVVKYISNIRKVELLKD
jgi:Ca2+-transporting ATPase